VSTGTLTKVTLVAMMVLPAMSTVRQSRHLVTLCK